MADYKTYLNREEKNELLMILGYTGYLEEIEEKWAKLERPKELLKYLRMTKTFNLKISDMIVKHLDKGQVEGLARLAKVQKKSLHKEVDQHEKDFRISWEDFCDMAEIVLCSCLQCTLAGKKQEQCNLKKILLRYDLDPLNDKPAPGQCPYQYKDVVTCKKQG